MSETFFPPYTWVQYSKRVAQKIERPRAGGSFTKEDAEARGMHLAVGSDGQLSEGNAIQIYLLVDPLDGLVVDAKYQLLGQSALIAAGEVATDFAIGKNYDQVRRVTADLLDRAVRDNSKEPAFPWQTSGHLNLTISALVEAAEACEGLPLPKNYSTPVSGDPFEGVSPEEVENWTSLPKEEQLGIIDRVLEQDVRPYIALDAGGVELLTIEDSRLVTIRYQGSCTSCLSSVGATLSYIQKMLQTKVHPELIVSPEM